MIRGLGAGGRGTCSKVHLTSLEGGAVVLLPLHPIILTGLAEESPQSLREILSARRSDLEGGGCERRAREQSTSRREKIRFWRRLSSSTEGKRTGSGGAAPLREVETTVAGADGGGVLWGGEVEVGGGGEGGQT
jgi:hypothetical protein